MNYCVIDFETTGVRPDDEVIEFAAVRVHGGELGLHLSSLCCPETKPIAPYITQINGISPEMVADKPPFAAFLPSLLDFIGDDTIVCHNVPFDMAFLRRACVRAGERCDFPTFCTLRESRTRFPFLRSRKLADVAAYLQIPPEHYHRALADASVTAKVLVYFLEHPVEGNV